MCGLVKRLEFDPFITPHWHCPRLPTEVGIVWQWPPPTVLLVLNYHDVARSACRRATMKFIRIQADTTIRDARRNREPTGKRAGNTRLINRTRKAPDRAAKVVPSPYPEPRCSSVSCSAFLCMLPPPARFPLSASKPFQAAFLASRCKRQTFPCAVAHRPSRHYSGDANSCSSSSKVTTSTGSKDSQDVEAQDNSTPLTGSAKLFAEAEEEERELEEQHRTRGRRSMSNTQRLHTDKLQFQHPNWTGDESTEDAVLRMLVDKYKPLRSGTTQTAEEKLRKGGPKPAATSIPLSEGESEKSPLETLEARIGAVEIKVDGTSGYQVKSTHSAPLRPTMTGSWATEPLLPSNPNHNPWDTTFKAPKEWTEAPSIKHASLIPSPKKPTPAAGPEDPKQKRKEREHLKRTKTAGRLGSAKEAMLDYRLGMKGGSAGDADRVGPERVNPSSLKGWTSLVEDRIEKARKAGAFNDVKGRGQPIARSTDEQNPFIDREEFFMNRIVQRNGAAPIWVELQNELEEAVNSFRSVLMESWVRTASTSISAELPPPSATPTLALPSTEWVARYRDRGWESRELGYHTAAMKEINALVRKYNGMAPYPVRRAPYTLEAEREKVYREGVEPIMEALRQRGKEGRLGGRDSLTIGGSGGSFLNFIIHDPPPPASPTTFSANLAEIGAYGSGSESQHGVQLSGNEAPALSFLPTIFSIPRILLSGYQGNGFTL
ncbi:hypothetical protein NMY22_g738 [Coprinellus aureogranulatus]|nr:hypothetical protein NMY22_g738 [Coprinellus aureogranulatus]